MKKIRAFLVILILMPLMAINAQQSNYETKVNQISSSNVEDDFVLNVGLPPSYNNTKNKYPLLMVLDGDKSFGMARDIVDWLSWSKEIPELIVVGISYEGSMQDWWQKRSRDFTPTKDEGKIWGEWHLAGGASDFQTFISTELIPFIEQNYRITDERVLAGMSFGGLFCTYTLFTKPDIFNRYIIVSPALAWNNKVIWQYENQYFSNNSELQARVFTAVGGLDQSVIIEPWKNFNELINNRKYKGVTWESHLYEGETHISSWPVALTRGLKTVFETKLK
ncbi:alpha/beta hydrolase [Balneolaceae bacterium YR4-1]|uniref:Alpha/beta hydrolase n=1 Tax=Halalkalibaculum roseum TaxID=2709311 RepID=A0A6M1SQX4_9BACT|nr:alpha/beta hydrolase-fold protein [Halalkalibaculum roseum]NGP75122.1 alpha/beta hydrolase [Halalkalibaculum roseum]